jgi:hypothetical protein
VTFRHAGPDETTYQLSSECQVSGAAGAPGESTLAHQAVRLTLTRSRSRTNETGRSVGLPGRTSDASSRYLS